MPKTKTPLDRYDITSINFTIKWARSQIDSSASSNDYWVEKSFWILAFSGTAKCLEIQILTEMNYSESEERLQIYKNDLFRTKQTHFQVLRKHRQTLISGKKKKKRETFWKS